MPLKPDRDMILPIMNDVASMPAITPHTPRASRKKPKFRSLEEFKRIVSQLWQGVLLLSSRF